MTFVFRFFFQNIAFINQELVAQGYADWIEEADEEEVETHQEVLAQ